MFLYNYSRSRVPRRWCGLPEFAAMQRRAQHSTAPSAPPGAAASLAGYVCERAMFLALLALVIAIAALSPRAYGKNSEQALLVHTLYFSIDKSNARHAWAGVWALYPNSLGLAFGVLLGWTVAVLARDTQRYGGVSGWCEWTQSTDALDGLSPLPCELLLPRVVVLHTLPFVGHLADLKLNWEHLRACAAGIARYSALRFWTCWVAYFLASAMLLLGVTNLLTHSDGALGGLLVDKYNAAPWVREASFSFFAMFGASREDVIAQRQWPMSQDFVLAIFIIGSGMVFSGVITTIIVLQLSGRSERLFKSTGGMV
jgi:hypothetical protein